MDTTTTTTTSEASGAPPVPPTVVVPVVTAPESSTETLVQLAQQIERIESRLTETTTSFQSGMADIREIAERALATSERLALAAAEEEVESEGGEVVEVEPTPLPPATTPQAPKAKRHPILAVFLGKLP